MAGAVDQSEFSSWDWHDASIHCVSIEEITDGLGRLLLDLDYIVEWNAADSGNYSFVVSPAVLCFEAVSNLAFNVDYASNSMAVSPMMIDKINVKTKKYGRGHTYLDCEIRLSWPSGFFRFSAESFTMKLVGSPIKSMTQTLSRAARRTV